MHSYNNKANNHNKQEWTDKKVVNLKKEVKRNLLKEDNMYYRKSKDKEEEVLQLKKTLNILVGEEDLNFD